MENTRAPARTAAIVFLSFLLIACPPIFFRYRCFQAHYIVPSQRKRPYTDVFTAGTHLSAVRLCSPAHRRYYTYDKIIPLPSLFRQSQNIHILSFVSYLQYKFCVLLYKLNTSRFIVFIFLLLSGVYVGFFTIFYISRR